MTIIRQAREWVAHGQAPQTIFRFLSLRHDRDQDQGHERGRAFKGLQEQQRLVEGGPGEWTKARERAPNGDRREHENSRHRHTRLEPKRRPQQQRHAEEFERVMAAPPGDDAVEDREPDNEERRAQRGDLQRLPWRPVDPRPERPEEQHGSDDQVADRVAHPPRRQDRPEVRPSREATEGEGEYAGHRADQRARSRGEPRELEHVAGAVTHPGPPRETAYQPGAHEALEGVARSDAYGRRNRPRGRDVDKERAEQDGGPNFDAGKQEGREGNARVRPHGRRTRVHEGEPQPQLAGDEIADGEGQQQAETSQPLRLHHPRPRSVGTAGRAPSTTQYTGRGRASRRRPVSPPRRTTLPTQHGKFARSAGSGASAGCA